MLIDDVTIKVRAGKGGNGMVAFAKTLMNQGPTGGDGGRGGNIIVRGVNDLGALRPFKTKKLVVAKDGGAGEQNMRTGANGADGIVIVPVGTVVHDLTNKKDYEINKIGQEIVIAKGGNGGFGNFYFRSSTNTTPEQANPGAVGENVELRLELKLIADIGFVGYPNVGKSSLLNELTNASSKVANYKFTTLEPHLGVYYELILADIPGIIEGASEGKGLGIKFLKHIERTKILFHFIAADSENPVEDYEIIRGELGKFNPELLKKDEWVLVSKTDEKSPEEVEKIVKKLKKKNPQIISLSLLDDKSVEGLKKVLNEIKAEK
ncbi:MAG: GTPase obg [Candidatus Moranbacteria bacterium GW2011_GWE1_35_17]|nr:MAG: GTPase obg [Candidatus Moranbacteria bacterium GW2011_GWE2_35_164]KKP67364.1 MAG: GTPase obg [Candidatus Moranbacteria bacterium GW2011_GWE1_35_17]KKP80995.1 MAG: GTPase obg [Candidatus Moranbacteria bacterium GW2011_GWF1_35_5]KKP81940.1 MAG: GTPase obg [Candidatus Moranbacteria bacterium GW2011_GWF2_35_54]